MTTCSECRSEIFVAYIDTDGAEIWSHVQEGCDDPVPAAPCQTCGSDEFDLYVNGQCAFCWTPTTDEDFENLPVLSLIGWASNPLTESENSGTVKP